jgi:Fe-S-cluster containining protein
LRKFECQQCGHCCTRLVGKEYGKTHGIYLTPAEAKFFPPETIFPLFRAGERIFAYQLGVSDCPNLVNGEHGRKACKIYQNRPLICRAFPATVADDGQLTVLFDQCTFTAQHLEDNWDMESFSKPFEAVREQVQQANDAPQATEVFVLDRREWVSLND